MMWRVAALACVLSFIALSVFWRMWSQRRRYGTYGVRLFGGGRLKYHVRDALLVAFFTTVTAQATLIAVLPEDAGMFGHLRVLDSTEFHIIGLALAIAATAFLVAGQEQLGAAWRVGIDDSARPGLRSDGLYAVCRNPIYVAWWLWTVAYVLLLPTVVSIVTLFGLTLAIHWYVEEEEEYLARVYGETYRAYARRVSRFVPGVAPIDRHD